MSLHHNGVVGTTTMCWVVILASCCCWTLPSSVAFAPAAQGAILQPINRQSERCTTQLWLRRNNRFRLRRRQQSSSKQRQHYEDVEESSTAPTQTTRSALSTKNINTYTEDEEEEEDQQLPFRRGPRKIIRRRVKQIAKGLVSRPLSLAGQVPMPTAIASVLADASLAAVEEVEDVILRRAMDRTTDGSLPVIADTDLILGDSRELLSTIIDDAFSPMEDSLNQMEESLRDARKALQAAKLQSAQAIEAIQVASIAQAEGAAQAVAQAEKVAERQVLSEIYATNNAAVNVSDLTFDDVDYESSEMAPPFLDPDSCLIPGEPVVRVEKAPENSRRIFAGVDIMAGVDDVWQVLTEYDNLQNVIPNLVVNQVLDLYDGPISASVSYDQAAPEEVKCKQIAEQMKGSLLKQVGGAKVVGINFSAKTTLEVREWPNGMPDFGRFKDDMWMGKSRDARAKEYPKVKLKRYSFPRPFALSSLPTKDISMQSIANDDGEFRMYQGVWRMQPLPGCAPPGKQAMRLTYAVEISPRAYLPVQLVEGRIVKDLCTNLEAIRNAVTG